MNDKNNIGNKIKQLRKQNNFTLKYVSEQTNLSVGFLSQLERGMTTIAIDSLSKISKILNVEINYFFDDNKTVSTSNITRSFEKKCNQINEQIIQFTLSQNLSDFTLLPRIFHLMPFMDLDDVDFGVYTHEGEEFIYVLEGCLSIAVNDQEDVLYPGDSIQINSTQYHNWRNTTNSVTKILCVNTPNPYKSK